MILLLLACDKEPPLIQVHGTVTESADPDSEPRAGVEVEVRDYTLLPVDSTISADDGSFDLTTTAGTFLALTLTGEAGVPTSFTGVAGSVDLDLEPGQTWQRAVDDDLAMRALFAGCPTLAEDGSLMEGEIRLVVPGMELSDPDQEWPLAATAFVSATDQSGVEHEACYLDDEGTGWADNTATGATGRFAIFGLPEGVNLVHVGYTADDVIVWEGYAEIWSPAEGVAPLYPLTAELPE